MSEHMAIDLNKFYVCSDHQCLVPKDEECPYCRIAELEHDINQYREIDQDNQKRIAELESEVKLYRGRSRHPDDIKRIAELESRLGAVTKLPGQWRDIHAAYNSCADDLEAALGGDDE